MAFDQQALAMTPYEQQVETLRQRYPGASSREWANSVALVIVPDVPLPKGWNRTSTTVRFVVPAGYPFANPDCFFVDPSVRLEGERMPQNSAMQALGELGEMLWFSWHLNGAWRPNKDTLTTWMAVIAHRFEQLQ